MAPRTKSFNNARPRRPAGEGNSAAPPNNSTIAKKVLGTTTGKISFLPKEAPSVTLQREFRQYSNAIRRGGVCLGGDPALTVNPDSIAQIASSREGAQAFIQAINRGVVIKALILEVGDNMVRERERLRRLIKKVINLRDKMVTQKAKIKVLKSRRKENTPATKITAGSNTLVTRKKKIWNTRNA